MGGIIPDEDIPKLTEAGVAAIFGPGTNTHAVIEAFHKAIIPARDGE